VNAGLPTGFWAPYPNTVWSARAWLPERRRKRMREARFFIRPQEAGDRQPPAARDQIEALDAELRVLVAVEPHPERVEGPLADAPVMLTLRKVSSLAVTVTTS